MNRKESGKVDREGHDEAAGVAASAVLAACLGAGQPAVLVTVAEARGSTPREAGAAMIVTADGIAGTIGGGRFEWEAAARARALIAAGEAAGEVAIALGPEIGQCCGGHAVLHLERATPQTLARVTAAEAAARAARPAVVIFGAGHVGRALAVALSPLPFAVRLVDGRAQAFAGFAAADVATVVTDRMTAEVAAAPAGSAFVIMTHSHALDAVIALEALTRGDFGYLGVIGSRTKRRRLQSALRGHGIPAATLGRLTCPIGAGPGGGRAIRDKRPAVIAALTAVELLAVYARVPASKLRMNSDSTRAPVSMSAGPAYSSG